MSEKEQETTDMNGYGCNSPPESNDFIVIQEPTENGDIRLEYPSSCEASLLDARQLVRALRDENQELREKLQENTIAFNRQYEVLKKWKETSEGRNEALKQHYDEARDIVSALREENTRLKAHREEIAIQLAKYQHDDIHRDPSSDKGLENDIICEQLEKLQEENEELKKKLNEAEMRTSQKKMVSSSLEVHVLSQNLSVPVQTQTENTAADCEKLQAEVDKLRQQISQVLNDLESLQKLKDDVEQHKGRTEMERDALAHRLSDKEDALVRLLREKREVVAMNNQLSTDIERITKENQHLWEKEKESQECLATYDISSFSRELDEKFHLSDKINLSKDEPSKGDEEPSKGVGEESSKGDEEPSEGVGEEASKGDEEPSQDDKEPSKGEEEEPCKTVSEDRVDGPKTIQQILLRLQEQQEENLQVSEELHLRSQQVVQLENELVASREAAQKHKEEIEQVRASHVEQLNGVKNESSEKENALRIEFSEERQKLEEKISNLEEERQSKVTEIANLLHRLEETKLQFSSQVDDLHQELQRSKADKREQAQLVTQSNDNHNKQIDEMRCEILRLSEASANKEKQSADEKRQVALLQEQLGTLMADLQSEHTKLQVKAQMCGDYQAEVDRLNAEMQRSQTRNNETVEAMRLQIGSLQSKLVGAQEEVVRRRNDNDELTKHQAELLNDYQGLLNARDEVVAEKNKLADEHQRIVMQLRTASINRQEQFVNLEREAREKQEEVNTLQAILRTREAEEENISVYKVQAEVFREDFQREREARERAHADIGNLQIALADARAEAERSKEELGRVQQEFDNFARQQISQMQRQEDYVLVPQAQPTRRTYPYPGGRAEELDNFGFPRQEAANINRPKCPKCRRDFPDMEALQIHLHDCLDSL